MIRRKSHKLNQRKQPQDQTEVSSRTLKKEKVYLESLVEKLSDACRDSGSRHRLMWLAQQGVSAKRPVREAAKAEIEFAAWLVEVGFTVAFLPESEIPTADLECYWGEDRVFVEVTVIVGQRGLLKKGTFSPGQVDEDQEEWDDEKVLGRRIVARIAEKARQLSAYCAPVLLAITVKDAGAIQGRSKDHVQVDLKRLVGVLVSTFPQVPQVSGVLLTLWDIHPAESIANIRLTNFHIIERPGQVNGAPRVRMLGWNPVANYPLESTVTQVLPKALDEY
jgi:hypothetical protein